MKLKIHLTAAPLLLIVLYLSTTLAGQQNILFRTIELEDSSSKKNTEINPTQFPFHEYLAKNNKLLHENEELDACIKYKIYYTCTPSNMYENLKNLKPEGIFYSFDDKRHRISYQYKKRVDNMEVKTFSTLIFSEKQIISVQFTTCMEQVKENMLILNDLIEKYAKFITDCHNK